MLPLGYNISITGDCSENGTGQILFTITGGTSPYTVNLNSPFSGSYPTYGELLLSGLTEGIYSGSIVDSSIPPLTQLFETPISGGVCISFEQSSIDSSFLIQHTTCGLNNGSVTLNSTSQYSSVTYILYDSEDNFINSAQTNQFTYQFLNLSAGTYYAVVQDIGGCSASTPTFIIETSNPLNFGLLVIPNAACGEIPVGKLIVTGLTGTPPFTYLWSNGSIEDRITGLTDGTYTVTVTDSFGCQHTESGTIERVPPVGLGVITSEQPTCFENDGSITITVTGGTSPYLYSASTGEQYVSYSQSFTFSGLSPGQYVFSVTDATFCSFTTNTNLNAPGGLESISISTMNSTCSSSDGSITISVVGGSSPYTYTLIDSSGNTLENINLLQVYTFNNLSSGLYTVAVQDNTGCGKSDEVMIIATDKFTISVSSTPTTCNISNGSVTVEATTGYTPPLTYSLDGSQTLITSLTAVTFSNVSAGQHTVTVTDAFGCVQTKQIFVPFSIPLLFSLYAVQCNGGNNGSVTALITSGTPPYSFQWSNNIPGNPQTSYVEGLGTGTYGVTIVDSSNCSLYQEVSIRCGTNFNSGTSGILFQKYIMGEDIFILESPTKCGLLEMLNEGYQNLIEDNVDCTFNSATFTAKVTVNPLGLELDDEFFTTTSLIIAPADNIWYDTVKGLLLQVPGVGNVIIDPLMNTITIQTIPDDNSLDGQEIIIELEINYDVNCLG